MRYVEAFNALGYQVESPRQDWSAEKADGVCITIWRKELLVANGLPYLDLWEMNSEDRSWTEKIGHKKRTRHLVNAVDNFEGRVDVILISGDPRKGAYEDAAPWVVSDRQGKGWHITKFDPATGFFRAEIST